MTWVWREACGSGARRADALQSTIHNPQSTIHNPQSSIENLQFTIPNPLLTSGMRMRYILLAYPKAPLGARLTYEGNAGEKPTTQNLRIVLTSNGALVYNFNMTAIRGGLQMTIPSAPRAGPTARGRTSRLASITTSTEIVCASTAQSRTKGGR